MNTSALTQRWVILGASGQVGRALTKVLNTQHPRIITFPCSRVEANLLHPDQCISTLEKLKPNVIINASAYTQVDLAEKEEELACQINGTSPGILASWCAKNNIPFIHFSTDYVFSGSGSAAWTETDATSPQNAYGRSKALGEKAVIEAGGKYLIFRTSWVYDADGKNFLNTMLQLGKERETLRIVQDQVGAPTFAKDIAQATYQCIAHSLEKREFPSGIYHMVNEGETNWFEFAQFIFNTAKRANYPLKVKELTPITTEEYPTPAKRPKNSRLSTKKLKETFQVELPHWTESLQTCIKEKLLENQHR